jgi:amino acid transporter
VPWHRKMQLLRPASFGEISVSFRFCSRRKAPSSVPLFGALYAVNEAGPAALFSWGLGGVVVVLLALVHAELGAMFPLAGGTARYPHFAYGTLTGFTWGWIGWLGAVTIAPIEVEAVIQAACTGESGNSLTCGNGL